VAIIQIGWDVANLDTLLDAGFDQQKIEWEDPIGDPGVWTEITRATTRLPLAANVERYIWEGPTDIAYNFQAVPYRTTDETDDTPIAVTDKVLRGYCTIADMRTEGYQDPPHSDARVQGAIDLAMKMIDRICGQRFDAYFATMSLNVKRMYDEHHLDVPIAALWKITDDDSDILLSDIEVYNRHLTQALDNPNDRANPMIAYGTDHGGVFAGGRFNRGRKTLKLWGVFGYTEIGAGDLVGETAAGSQIPLSYGSTPLDIHRACMLLVADHLGTLATGGNEASLASRVLSQKTMDQSYTLQAKAAAEAVYGMTGNDEADAILMRYPPPLPIGSV
jgi:hypothetical protein